MVLCFKIPPQRENLRVLRAPLLTCIICQRGGPGQRYLRTWLPRTGDYIQNGSMSDGGFSPTGDWYLAEPMPNFSKTVALHWIG